MKTLKIPSRFVQAVFLSGIATLLAGCPTTQGPSTGAQAGVMQARSTTAAQAQTSAPATDMRAPPAATKQRVASALPAPAKVVLATAPSAAGAVATVSYQELVKLHADDLGDTRKANGKTVQVAVSGKGEIGYFAKKSDAITFVCNSGDKRLTANKATKGLIRGIVFDSSYWEGAIVYQLKDCQIVK